MSLTHSEAMHGLHLDGEGSISIVQAEYLKSIPGPLHVAETGFGLGWSAWSFLDGHPQTCVTSFDIGVHAGSLQAKDVLDKVFPRRHSLVLGDSKITAPQLLSEVNTFDLVFVDGGHDYETATADLRNFARPGRRVVIDDLVSAPWAEGVVRAWREAQERGLLRQTEMFGDNDHHWASGIYL